MKTLSIQQPWASMIAAGIKDVENRTWKTPYRGKILIHASSKKVTKNFFSQIYLEWCQSIANHIMFGNLPEMSDLPTCAIVGYATLVGFTEEDEDSDSLWDGGPGQIKWHLEDAHLFDEPITGVNGKLNLWDYPDIDEDNLPPAHRVELKFPHVVDEELVVPVAEYVFECMEEGADGFNFDAFDGEEYMSELFPFSDNWIPVEFDTIKFVCGEKTKSMKVTDKVVGGFNDDNGNPLTGISFHSGEEEERLFLAMDLEEL